MIQSRDFLGRGLALLATALFAALASIAAPVCGQGAYRAEEYLLLPVRFHLLRASHVSELTSHLQFADVRRILGEINRIWRPAGVQFFAESLLHEPVAAEELFHMFQGEADEAQLRVVRPGNSRSDRMIHVYFIHSMRPNGVTLNYQMVFVRDRAELDTVPGGTHEPLARVTAHEFGHALDLDHTPDRSGLMASGTTGTHLSSAEISVARKAAAGMAWHLDPAGLLALADERAAGDPVAAADGYRLLAALPDGPITQAARDRLAKLSRP